MIWALNKVLSYHEPLSESPIDLQQPHLQSFQSRYEEADPLFPQRGVHCPRWGRRQQTCLWRWCTWSSAWRPTAIMQRRLCWWRRKGGELWGRKWITSASGDSRSSLWPFRKVSGTNWIRGNIWSRYSLISLRLWCLVFHWASLPSRARGLHARHLWAAVAPEVWKRQTDPRERQAEPHAGVKPAAAGRHWLH